MHEVTVPRDVIEQTVERRGTLHPLADFDPATTALLVVDMQRFFIDMVPNAASLVPNINRLAAGLRAVGGRVVWISMTADPADRDSWSHFYRKLLSAEGARAHHEDLARGSAGWQLCDGLDAQADDEFVEKHRFSALIQGSSDLERRLRDAGIRTVLVTGTVTNVCCESTARDAMMLDFETIMVADGCEALSDEAHLAALCNFQAIFGDVLDVADILAAIEARPSARRASAR